MVRVSRARIAHALPEGERKPRKPREPCPKCGKKICECLVLELAGQMRDVGIPTPERERTFAPGRKWKFDFAWPYAMIAVEVEGGIWGQGEQQGAHTRGAHFLSDAEKYNTAAIMGWMVLRFAVNHIKSGEAVKTIELALRSRGVTVAPPAPDTSRVKYPAH